MCTLPRVQKNVCKLITALSASPQSSFVTMEKGSPGVGNKIGPLAYDELSQVLQEVEGCPAKTAISAISAISPEIANKLEKSQFLLKLIKSSVTGGRRVPSKNWDFCSSSGL